MCTSKNKKKIKDDKSYYISKSSQSVLFRVVCIFVA